jgi:hypothetical protein
MLPHDPQAKLHQTLAEVDLQLSALWRASPSAGAAALNASVRERLSPPDMRRCEQRHHQALAPDRVIE